MLHVCGKGGKLSCLLNVGSKCFVMSAGNYGKTYMTWKRLHFQNAEHSLNQIHFHDNNKHISR